MGKESGISWTDNTFNPWWGCTKVSPGCEHCYAETMASRYKFEVWGPYRERRRTWDFKSKHWQEPLHWNKKCAESGTRERVFCGSMMDWCDKDAPYGHVGQLFTLIQKTPNLDWLLLTKRTERIAKTLPGDFSAKDYPNVWLGTTIESNDFVHRAQILAGIDARVHFLSMEPLLGPCPDLDLTGIQWVIVGGESGNPHRKMDKAWAEGIMDKCITAKHKPAFFFKQDSGPYSGLRSDLLGMVIQRFPREGLVHYPPNIGDPEREKFLQKAKV